MFSVEGKTGPAWLFKVFLLSPADPDTTAVARLSRAEAYVGLKQYRQALEDTEFCPQSSCSAEVGHSVILQEFVSLQ